MNDHAAEAIAHSPTDGNGARIVTWLSRADVLAAVEVSCFVLRPGETLIVRVPAWMDDEQIRGYKDRIDVIVRQHKIPNDVILLAGEQFAKLAQSEPMRYVGEAAPTGPRPAIRVDSER